jgi:ubiquinone/menaquinone biosynthesis C-methylase UbiE
VPVSGHDDVVQAEFSKQAADFESPGYAFTDPRLMAWIRKHVAVEPGSVVLDVAGGTGHVARSLSSDARLAVVLHLTASMLEEGKRQAEAAEIRNVLFERGDAAALPYLDESFDLVINRFAIHHFEEPALQVAEMVRVCRVGGRVAVIDLVAIEPDLSERHNRLERLRDPSHTTALTEEALGSLLGEAGAEIVHSTSVDRPIDVERWLRQAGAPVPQSEQIRAELRAELDGDAPTGMRPLMNDGGLHYTQRWVICVAERRRALDRR